MFSLVLGIPHLVKLPYALLCCIRLESSLRAVENNFYVSDLTFLSGCWVYGLLAKNFM